MKNKVQHIVVHSTQTFDYKVGNDSPFHYIIHRNGWLKKGKQFESDDVLIQLAYVGGIDSVKKLIDNRTTRQKETLITTLKLLQQKFPNVKTVGADEQFGSLCYPGFGVKDWLRQYEPEIAVA